MALSEASKKEIASLKTRYPDRAAATLPALYVVQRERELVDDEGVREVAALLELDEIRVREVATWYTMYHKHPVGKHLVEICTNLSCHLTGGQELLDSVCHELGVKPGETTADGRFTVHEVECLGSCGTAPALQVDGDFHENMTPEKVAAVLRAAD
ncbi:MAG: NADH-quinone oxidoreductase subunit NuoE [Pseudomonadota bacterium]